MRSVEAAGLKDKTTYIVVTDHGFKKVRRTIDVNVALQAAGLIRIKGKGVTDCDAYTMPEGGLAFVYINDPARRAELLPKLKRIAAGIEGIDQVIDGADANRLGMPTPAENSGTGDLILFAKPGYAFLKGQNWTDVVSESKTYLGTHGYPASDPELDGIFLASGVGIKKGVALGRVSNLDVAPTAARLLGITLPNVEGKPIAAALEQK
jgi:predicted AlkP superfamily pyrophosphatase or phosphodiesterase